VTLENGGESAASGKIEVLEIGEPAAEFARPPGGMLVAQREDELLDLGSGASGRRERSFRSVGESMWADREKKFEKAMASVAADVELAAERGDVGSGKNGGSNESKTLRQD
jgi:hypothetical protein